METSVMSTYRIVPLSGTENYATWSTRLEDLLVDLDLWEYANGTKPMPAAAADDAQAAWKKADRKALAAIRLRVSDPIMMYVRWAKTAEQAWTTLARLYPVSGTDMAPGAALRQRIVEWVIKEDADVEVEIYTILSLHNRLSRTIYEIPDKTLAYIILVALPGSWDRFFKTVYPDKEHLDDIVIRILEEATKRRSRTGIRGGMRAVGPNGKIVKSAMRASKFKKGVSRYCKREGHYESECRAKARDEKGKGKKIHANVTTKGCIQ